MGVEAFGLATITVLLTFSSVILVADAAGLLPDRISRWVNRNRARQTLEALKELGFDVDPVRRRNVVARLPPPAAGSALPDRVRPKLDRATVKGPLKVGDVERVRSEAYIDVMGLSTDPAAAKDLARDLVARWRSAVERDAITPDPQAVAAPKVGSPLLAAAVAEILDVPLILVNPKEKFDVGRKEPKAWLDFAAPLPRGTNVLLVDDSTTGGGKALASLQVLNEAGLRVTDFLVIFEPQLKNARAKLENKGVRLHAILTT